jgi:hypothetical protein
MALRKPLFNHSLGLEQLPASDRVQLNILNLGVKGPALTPVSNSITITNGRHSLFSTNATASLRNVHTILGGVDGDVLVLQGLATGSLNMIVKDNTGNLKLAGDFTFDQLYDTMVLQCDGPIWLELMRSNNGT